jgi:hypothetical protein
MKTYADANTNNITINNKKTFDFVCAVVCGAVVCSIGGSIGGVIGCSIGGGVFLYLT